MSPTVALVLVVLVLSAVLVLALVLALALVLTVLRLALVLAAFASWALLALVAFPSDPAPLIERATLLGFAFLLCPHFGLLALTHLVWLRSVPAGLARLPLVLALEGAALLAHPLLETTLLGLLTLNHRAGRSRFPFGCEPSSPFLHSGNSRAIDFDGATLNRDIPQIGGT